MISERKLIKKVLKKSNGPIFKVHKLNANKPVKSTACSSNSPNQISFSLTIPDDLIQNDAINLSFLCLSDRIVSQAYTLLIDKLFAMTKSINADLIIFFLACKLFNSLLLTADASMETKTIINFLDLALLFAARFESLFEENDTLTSTVDVKQEINFELENKYFVYLTTCGAFQTTCSLTLFELATVQFEILRKLTKWESKTMEEFYKEIKDTLVATEHVVEFAGLYAYAKVILSVKTVIEESCRNSALQKDFFKLIKDIENNYELSVLTDDNYVNEFRRSIKEVRGKLL